MKVAQFNLVGNEIVVSSQQDAEGEIIAAKITIKNDNQEKYEFLIHISKLATLGQFLIEASRQLNANGECLSREVASKRAKFWKFGWK